MFILMFELRIIDVVILIIIITDVLFIVVW